MGKPRSYHRKMLDKINLRFLITKYSIEEISQIYKAPLHIVKEALKEQMINKNDEKVSDFVKQQNDTINDEFSIENYFKSKGLWMNSKERESFKKLKTI